jgi:hypothetical protein
MPHGGSNSALVTISMLHRVILRSFRFTYTKLSYPTLPLYPVCTGASRCPRAQVLRALARSRAPRIRRRFLQLAVADFLGREIALEHDACAGAARGPARLAHSSSADCVAATPDRTPSHRSRGSGGGTQGARGPSDGVPGNPDAAASARPWSGRASAASAAPLAAEAAGGAAAGATDPGHGAWSGPRRGASGGRAPRPPVAPPRPPISAGAGRTPPRCTEVSDAGALSQATSDADSCSTDPGSDSDSDAGLAPSRHCLVRDVRPGMAAAAARPPRVPAIVCPQPCSSSCSEAGSEAGTPRSADAADARAARPAPAKAAASPACSARKRSDAAGGRRPTIAVAASSASAALGAGAGGAPALVIPAGFCFTGDVDEDIAALEALEGDLSAPPSPRSTPRETVPFGPLGAPGRDPCRGPGAMVPRLGGLARAGSEPWGRGGGGDGPGGAAPARAATALDRVPRLALQGSLLGTPPPRQPSPWAQVRSPAHAMRGHVTRPCLPHCETLA